VEIYARGSRFDAAAAGVCIDSAQEMYSSVCVNYVTAYHGECRMIYTRLATWLNTARLQWRKESGVVPLCEILHLRFEEKLELFSREKQLKRTICGQDKRQISELV
jgi:hypothetical protein